MAKNYIELSKLKDSYLDGTISAEAATAKFIQIYNNSKNNGKERRCAKRIGRMLNIPAISLLIEL